MDESTMDFDWDPDPDERFRDQVVAGRDPEQEQESLDDHVATARPFVSELDNEEF